MRNELSTSSAMHTIVPIIPKSYGQNSPPSCNLSPPSVLLCKVTEWNSFLFCGSYNIIWYELNFAVMILIWSSDVIFSSPQWLTCWSFKVSFTLWLISIQKWSKEPYPVFAKTMLPNVTGKSWTDVQDFIQHFHLGAKEQTRANKGWWFSWPRPYLLYITTRRQQREVRRLAAEVQ